MAEAKSVPNYLVQAILCTIFCCLPFGVVAIVYAAQVNSLVQAGKMADAQEAAKKAKTWCWVAFGVGLTAFILYMAFIGLAILIPVLAGHHSQ